MYALLLFTLQVGKPGFFLWLLVVTTEVTSGRHVVKRADDTDPLEAVVGTHSQVGNHCHNNNHQKKNEEIVYNLFLSET